MCPPNVLEWGGYSGLGAYCKNVFFFAPPRGMHHPSSELGHSKGLSRSPCAHQTMNSSPFRLTEASEKRPTKGPTIAYKFTTTAPRWGWLGSGVHNSRREFQCRRSSSLGLRRVCASAPPASNKAFCWGAFRGGRFVGKLLDRHTVPPKRSVLDRLFAVSMSSRYEPLDAWMRFFHGESPFEAKRVLDGTPQAATCYVDLELAPYCNFCFCLGLGFQVQSNRQWNPHQEPEHIESLICLSSALIVRSNGDYNRLGCHTHPASLGCMAESGRYIRDLKNGRSKVLH